MLFIFRKLRRSFFQPGKARTYLAYAFGEIVLIMVGILLAVQVSEWNQARRDTTKEVEILKSIKTELALDQKDLSINIFIHESAIESAGIIIKHIEDDLPYKDSLAKDFFNSNGISLFQHTSSAFQTLKAHGVDLISNKSLRGKIIGLYDGWYNVLLRKERELQERMLYRDNILFSQRFEETQDITHVEQDAFSRGNMIPLDFEQLKNDREYLYHIRTIENINSTYLQVFSYPLRQHLGRVMEEIDQEVQRLENR